MFHKITEIDIKDNFIIIAKFDNGIKKQYNMKKMIEKFEVFREIENIAVFKMVKVDQGGYGIVWNDDIDLSSEEIWKNGIEI